MNGPRSILYKAQKDQEWSPALGPQQPLTELLWGESGWKAAQQKKTWGCWPTASGT